MSLSSSRSSSPSLHVVLVTPEIPGNTGNAGRTCLATGARLHLVRPLGFSLDGARVRRAGLDYWPHVDLEVWPAWEAFEEVLPELGRPFLFTTEAERSFWDAGLAPRDGEPSVLVFGPEATGFAEEIRERWSENMVRIPMRDGPVRSLNLSASVAVAVYEALRPSTTPNPGSPPAPP